MALWRVEEAAGYLGIRPKTLYEWVRLGKVPYRKIGFNVRFDPAELEAWVAGQSAGAASDGEPREPPKKASRPRRKQAPLGASAADAGDAAALRRLAADASRTLRALERDVGASLSYPQRRELAELVERLAEAAAPDADEK